LTNLNETGSVFSVLDSVRRNFPISRSEICDITKLSIPSVSRIVNKLIDNGYISELEQEYNGLGRKAKLLAIKEGAVYTAGVFYDGNVMKLAIINEVGCVLASSSEELPKDGKTPEDIAGIIYSSIKHLFHRENIKLEKLFGIGVALSGIIDNETGMVRFSAVLAWENVAFGQILREVTGIHCVVDNDIKAAAHAECNNRNYNSDIAVLLYLGEGVGSSVIVERKILRGATNSAGELGHIASGSGGILCSCGKIGCYQTSVTNSFLLFEARKFAEIQKPTEIFLLPIKKNLWAKRIIDRYIRHSALLIDTAIGAYNPDTVILFGDIIDNIPGLFEDICKEYYDNFACDYWRYPFEIKKSFYDGNSVVAGVGIMASENFFLVV